MRQYLKFIFSALLFLAALMWWNSNIGTISYHEQLQMFLCDWDYFMERLSLPGGLADYIGEFLVNFFYKAQVGSGIIAGLITIIQLLSWMLIRKYANTSLGFALSFIPALTMWMTLGRPDILISLPVAVIAAILLCALFTGATPTKNVSGRKALPKMTLFNLGHYTYTLSIIIIPLFYWFFGTAVYGVILYLTIASIYRRRWVFTAFYPIFILLVIIGSGYQEHYPDYRIFSGLNYFRYPTEIPVGYFIPLATAAILPFLCLWLKDLFKKGNSDSPLVLLPMMVVISLPSYFLLKNSFDPKIHDTLEYDFLVRSAKWEKIIEKANKKTPDSPMTVVCLNLALQQSGQLPYRQFNYFQNGKEGLLQSMSKDFTSPLPTAEAMLRLGMVNAAQEYYFEAQEAIPNYRKSARITRRLAETNLINGQYDVAAKYLRMLEKTLFYSDWAKQTLKILGDEDAINRHPFYGEVRKNQYAEDFLISDREMDMMLGLLLVKNPKNRMAYEYLMSYIILQRDLEHFYEYFQLGKDMGYKTPPQIYQEVHALLEAQQTHDQRLASAHQNSGTWKYLLNN